MAKRHPHSASSAALRKNVDPSDAENEEEPAESDAPAMGTSNVEAYLENNGAKLGLLLLALIVAAVVVVWMIWSKNQKQVAAAEAFTSASEVGEYNLVINNHAGTIGAGNALIMRAKAEWDEGKQSESLDTLNQFLTGYQDHPLLAEALYGVAVREMAMGKKDVGVKHLEEVVEKYPKSAVAPLAQIYLADEAMEAGDVEGAKDLYGKAAKMGVGAVPIVEERLAVIKSGTPIEAIDPPPLPEVETPPTPVEPVTPGVTPPVIPPVVPVPTDPVPPLIPPTDPVEPTEPTPTEPTEPTEPAPTEPAPTEPAPAEPAPAEPAPAEPAPAEPAPAEPAPAEPAPAEPAPAEPAPAEPAPAEPASPEE